MTVKLKVQPMTRVGVEPLVEMAEHLRSQLPGWSDLAVLPGRQRATSDLALDLGHLSRHDADGLISVALGDEVVGFGTSYVRSRLLTIAPLWLLPEHESGRPAEALLRRLLAFGERSGVNDVGALVVGGPALHTLAYRYGLRPRFPIYRLHLETERARVVGQEFAKLRPGRDITGEAMERRAGLGDVERIDRLVRGGARPMDYEYWLVERRLHLVTVREGQRIAGYAWGGPGQCGPVAATTPESALAALGWALQLAAEHADERVTLLVPAPFEPAVEQLLEAGATCASVSYWLSKQPSAGMERYVLAGQTLI